MHGNVNFQRPLNIDEIAQHTGITTCHLNRLFKKHVGTSVCHTLRDVRLSADALKYIVDTSRIIADNN